MYTSGLPVYAAEAEAAEVAATLVAKRRKKHCSSSFFGGSPGLRKKLVIFSFFGGGRPGEPFLVFFQSFFLGKRVRDSGGPSLRPKGGAIAPSSGRSPRFWRPGAPREGQGDQGKARDGVPRASWVTPGFPLGLPGPPSAPLASKNLGDRLEGGTIAPPSGQGDPPLALIVFPRKKISRMPLLSLRNSVPAGKLILDALEG